MNELKLAELEPAQSIVKLCQWEDTEAEADEMWSFVQSKAQQRWLLSTGQKFEIVQELI
ncbi:hypothetical protein J5X98_20265 [Leptothermofonsia sichuanensis E412]|uniref:hypothetical protein n=1 Tax=Leptothermofonsia sichuanensis TaxID=2917832 RepID=UPI001CA70C5D|nr:hypothetical protein [Leptothermofonsia sichuanensis]QZZ19647.1 hypothetical protein J5X98_20265 [Leptothermofonsia sichuanensis E412]